MTDKIKIDIVSDVVCPWCVVGYKRLEKAIKELGVEDKVEIEWHPFELNPNLGSEGKKLYKHLSDRYDMGYEEIKKYHKKVTQDGMALGFEFNFDEDMDTWDTRDAHILIDHAKNYGKQTELQLRLFAAHFTKRKDISDKEVLIKEFEAVGLDGDEARAVLNEDRANKIALREIEWQKKGVSAVPTMVFQNSIAMNGAYAPEAYIDVLKEQLGLNIKI